MPATVKSILRLHDPSLARFGQAPQEEIRGSDSRFHIRDEQQLSRKTLALACINLSMDPREDALSAIDLAPLTEADCTEVKELSSMVNDRKRYGR